MRAAGDAIGALAGGPPHHENGGREEVADIEGQEGRDVLGGGWSLRQFFLFAGPGLIMSTAFIDPGDLEADLQAGAAYKYDLNWIWFWATLMGYMVCMYSAKLGIASGRDLAQLCKSEYSYPVKVTLWLLMEAALIGVEIQEVIGCGVGLALLCNNHIALWLGVLLSGILSYICLLLDSTKHRLLEVAFLLMIVVMCVTFAVLAGVADAPAGEVLKGLARPKLPAGSEVVAGGVVGGAITPYNMFFYSALVQKRKLDLRTNQHKWKVFVFYMIEAALALFLALFVNIATVVTFAKGFFGTTADIGLLNAGAFLEIQYGTATKYIWALGLFATGMAGTTATVYAGQFIMSGFIDIKISAWKRALFTRTVALVPCLAVALAYGRESNQIDLLNLWINVLQSAALPFALFPLIHFCCNPLIMGKWVNGWFQTLILIIGSTFGVGMTYYTLIDWAVGALPDRTYAIVLTSIACVVYTVALVFFSLGPNHVQRWLGFKTAEASTVKDTDVPVIEK